MNSLEGLPNVVAQVGGFRKGAKSVKPDIEVKVVYIKGMEDAAEAKEAALSLIAGGADFIFGKLNAGHAGLVQAAKEKNVFVSGRSFGHTEIAPDRVLTNIIEKWGDMYAAAAEASRTGKAGGQYMVYGFKSEGGAGAELRLSPDRAFNPAVPDAVVAEIEGAGEEIRLWRAQDHRHARRCAGRNLTRDGSGRRDRISCCRCVASASATAPCRPTRGSI